MVGETTVGKLVVEIVGDVSGLIEAYDKAQKQTEGIADQFTQIGDRMTSIGKDLTLKVTAPLALMGGVAFKTAADFDDSMRRVKAVSGATGEEFDALKAKALELGANTKFSAMEAAEGMGALGQAGFDASQIMQTMPGLLDLAATDMQLGLGEAAEITTAAIRGFHLEASESARVADVLAQASSSSGADVAGLGDALKYAAPMAAATNISIEETVAVIAQLSDVGIKGGQAGRGLAAALAALINPTTGAEKALAKYGLTVEDVNPEAHTFAEILDTLSDAGLESADVLEIFGQQAGRSMLSLLQAGGAGIRDYTRDLENSTGAAATMAKEIEGGLGGSIRQLKSTIDGLSISFGDLIGEMLMPAIEALKHLVGWFDELDNSTKKAIIVVGAFAAAVGPVTWVLGTMATSIGSLITLYSTYQASTIAATIATRGFTAAIMANPIGLAIIGVTTLGAVLLPLIASTNDATDAANKYADALRDIKGLTEKTTETIEDEIDALKAKEKQILADIDALKSQTVVTDRQTIATRQATRETGYHKLAAGDLTREYEEMTDAIKDGTVALGNLTRSQKDAALAALDQELATNRAAQAARDNELATRRLADGAKTAYDQASKAVTAHQKTVTALQKEYNKLKETIDKALGIDKKVEESDRDVERAEIRKIRAERDLEKLRADIKEREAEARAGDADAATALEDLRLREREAVIDVADAVDRYAEAQADAAKAQEERVAIEKELNGESIESARTRLDEIGDMLEVEQEKLEVALEKREEAQVAHENLMNQIENDALDTRSENWAEYVKFVNDNPAIARTYHVEYDGQGNPVGGIPTPPKLNIPVPTYSSPAFATASQSSASVAGATSASSAVAPTQTTRGSGGGVNIENLIVNSPKADATTMAHETKTSLRGIGTLAVI
ncbi:MAG: phage tail tape measure protein [Methanomicrobiales archaeon]|nr:phage tail tape measure protein [Methanomicrobiales archaeon]